MPDSSNIPREIEIKISELPVASEVRAADQLEANQAGTSRRITIEQIIQTLGSTSIVIADTAPGAPLANMMWWSSQLGELFIWYDDGDSAQWVTATPPPVEG